MKTVQEGEGAGESSQKHTVEHAQSQSLPTAAESAASVQAAASEPETHVPVTSFPATIPSNEVVVSIGDALVTVEQSCELLAPEDVHHEAQQPPATMAAAVPTAGPSRLLERASSRFHKGRCMFRSPIYLILLSMFQLYSIQNVIHILWHARAVWQLASLIVSAVAVLSLIIHQCSDYGIGLVIERSWVQFPVVSLSCNYHGQVVHTRMPLSLSNIIWYRPNGIGLLGWYLWAWQKVMVADH